MDTTYQFTTDELIALVQQADLISTLTPRAAIEAKILYGVENTIYNAVAFPPISLPKTEHGIFTFGYFGRIHPAKNISALISAFYKHLTTNNNNSLLLIGGLVQDAPHAAQLKVQACNLGIGEAVKFYTDKSEVNEHDIAHFYSLIDCFVCADLVDYNISTMQALMLGIPAITFSMYDLHPVLAGKVWFPSNTLKEFSDNMNLVKNDFKNIKNWCQGLIDIGETYKPYTISAYTNKLVKNIREVISNGY